MFNELVAAGAAADYVLLPSDPGGAAALLATNSYAQVWVYDLSSGADPWDADFQAIADWWVDESSGEIIADGRILGSYWSGRYATEGRVLAENYFENLRAVGGGLLLSTDHNVFANFGANEIGALIGIDPFIGNFSGAFPVDTGNPLMNTPNLIESLFNDTTTSQAPFGLQPNGLILDAVGFHSGNPQTPGISSTIDGTLNLVVEIVAPESGTQLCAPETVTAVAESTGATGPVAYSWTSDLDGALGLGSSVLLDASELTEGIHVIRVVADDDENIDDAEIAVQIGGCEELCGNGEIDGAFEQCDDGNLEDGDGCSSICQLEDPIVHNPYPVPDWPEAIQLNNSQDNAYLALQETGLDVHDVFDRDNATRISSFTASSECSPLQFFADEVALIEEDGAVDALISGGECGVVGVDVTDANNPTFIDNIPVSFGLVEEVAGIDSADGENLLLYVASFWQGLQIFEVIGDCDPASCVVNQRGSIGADDEWGASLAIWIEVVFQEEGPPEILAYVASTEGLQIVDVSDPDTPVLLGRLDTNPTDIPINDHDDVPQDVVVSGGLAFVPLWIGGFIVVDVQDPTNPVEVQRFAASPNTAFFKVEVSSRDNRIYVTEGISGVASFIQLKTGELVLEERLPIGVGDERCSFDEGGVSDICWAWAIDEVGELVGVSYGVLGPPHAGGYQLISMPRRSVEGEVLRTLNAIPVPEPRLLILQGVGVLAVTGLGRIRRRRRERSTQG
jgi:cysteine-rich repeat protein